MGRSRQNFGLLPLNTRFASTPNDNPEIQRIDIACTDAFSSKESPGREALIEFMTDSRLLELQKNRSFVQKQRSIIV